MDELDRERVELRLSKTFTNWFFLVVITVIQENNNDVIESRERFFFNGKSTVTISLVPAFNLHSNLLCTLSGVWMYTDKIIAFIVRWSLVRKDIATHKMTNDKVLGTKRDNRVSACVFVSHAISLRCLTY